MTYFLVALLDRAAAIKVHFESGPVGENWVGEPDCWDGIELGTCVFVKGCEIETGVLTSGSALKYQLTKREVTTNNPARKDAFRVDSSGMAQRGEGEVGALMLASGSLGFKGGSLRRNAGNASDPKGVATLSSTSINC